MTVKIIGLAELQAAFAEIIKNIENVEIITKELAEGMQQYVHVDSGYLKSTIFYNDTMAGATADYAEFEADRGGDHDYAQGAIDNFDFERYSDYTVRPF